MSGIISEIETDRLLIDECKRVFLEMKRIFLKVSSTVRLEHIGTGQKEYIKCYKLSMREYINQKTC